MHLLTKDLYSVKPIETDKWEVTLADENHPVFKAHFENNPLLPAFLQIDIFAEIQNREISKIERCKFKQPIFPNDIVEYKINKQHENSYRIYITKNTTICSELKIDFK